MAPLTETEKRTLRRSLVAVAIIVGLCVVAVRAWDPFTLAVTAAAVWYINFSPEWKD